MCMVYLDFSRASFYRAHTPSICHPYSPLTISTGSLYHKHTLSPSPCVHAIHVSLSTFVPCWPDLYWTCAIGVSLFVANNHTLAIFVYLLTSLFYLGDASMIWLHKKQKNILSLSLIYHLFSLSLSHTYSFCTLTHSPSHALDLSRLRHSPRSIAYRFIEKSNITKFDHVHGEKQLHLDTTKKYTSVMIRVCHSRSRFLSCMYIHDDFMTESR